MAQSQGTWEEATSAYEDERYHDAVEAYESLVERGVEGGALHYNLGNAYYKSGDMANAILHYERALRYLPGDTDIEHNLALVNSQRVDAVIPVRGFFLYRWIRSMSSLLGLCGWGVVSLLLLWGAIALFSYTVWYSAGKLFRRLAVVTAVCAVAAIALGAIRLSEFRLDHYAIVMQPMAKVMIAPDPESKVTIETSAGEKVRILDSLDNFYKIRLPNYEDGWIQKNAVERI
jgi:tetratricopeptide (TPR) repeat protein